MGVTLAVAARLAWRAGRAIRGADEAADGFEQALVGLFVFVVGAGSSVTYLTSRPSVFHEAIAWGIAVSLVAIEAVLAWTERRGAGRFVLLLALATAALLTRASVGAAPSLAIGFVLLRDLVAGVRGRDVAVMRRAVALGCHARAPARRLCRREPRALRHGVHAPVRSPIGVDGRRAPTRRPRANGGTIQGRAVPPDDNAAVPPARRPRPRRLVPVIDFPAARGPRRRLMDQIDVASSLPSSMPALFPLAAFGVVAMARDRRLRSFRFVVAGAGPASS